MLRWRLLLGTVLIAALVALCAFDARLPYQYAGVSLMPVALVAALLASREVLELAAAGNMRPLRWPVYLGVVLIVSGQCIYQTAANLWPDLIKYQGFRVFECGSPEWCVAVAAILSFLSETYRYRAPGGNLANISTAIFTAVYVGLMLRFAMELRLEFGVGALASWIVVVKMGDIGAYTVGRMVGRHKMAPVISPGKTLEGAVGALAFSCLGAWWSFGWLVPSLNSWMPVPLANPWWGWTAYGLLVGTAGMLGDLFESMLKRDVGRKDSSDWLPGFGGVLDILDSLLLSAPVAWFCWVSGLVGR